MFVYTGISEYICILYMAYDKIKMYEIILLWCLKEIWGEIASSKIIPSIHYRFHTLAFYDFKPHLNL